MDTFVKWTDEEWQAVAKRARAIKDSRPDMSWQQIVPVCQDDITPERRRFTINKLSGLKQMFDILDLDENGNVKPPPPPPPPPTPEPIVPPPVASPSPAPKLSEAPIDALVTEILSRGASMKALAEEVVVTKVVIENSLIAHKEQMEVLSQRVDGMERTVLELDERVMTVLNRCERINLDYTELTKLNTILHEALMACDQEALMKVANQTATGGVQLMQAEMQKGTLTHDGHLNPPKVQRVAPVRFLVVGPLPKDVTRIKERLPRSLNVEIILGENNDQIKLPANIDYCVVSGHADFTRRWQTCRDAYGQSKVHRMENGSIGTFANQIEVLASLHHKQHVKAA